MPSIINTLSDIRSGFFDQEDLRKLRFAIDQRLYDIQTTGGHNPTEPNAPVGKKELEYGDVKIGDKVWFNDKVSPKYLVGERCTVVKINRERVKVTLDRGSIGRFSGGPTRCPLSILTNINPGR